ATKRVIQEFLRTGDHDPLFLQFPGHDHLDRIVNGHRTHTAALLSEVQIRSAGAASLKRTVRPKDIQAFSRKKVEPMVRGLFKRVDQEAVTTSTRKFRGLHYAGYCKLSQQLESDT
ncbi:MAG: hypothetical protein ABI557_21335, partial [Aureliella sp.]